MSKRREATPVSLTRWQRDRLERIWFLYGNYGSQTTPGNHSFIQRLIENGIDERPLITKRTPKSQRPTAECEAAVEKILKGSEPGEGRESRTVPHLRIVPPPDSNTRRQEMITPELKTIMSEIKSRSNSYKGRAEMEDNDTPDAAA